MMKKIFNRAFVFLAAGLMLGACEENTIPEITVPVSEEGANVKFFFHVEGAPRTNFYLDNQKVTGVAPTAEGVVLGNAYGSVYPSNAYALVPAGSFTMSAIDTVSANGGTADVLATSQVTLEKGKNYSAYLVGTTDSYDTFVAEDNLPPADNIKIWWRFVNTMADLPFEVDAYAVRAAVPATDESPAEGVEVVELGKNIDFKELGDYKELKPGSYAFKVYESGTEYDPATTSPFIQHSVVLSSLGRVYTTQIRGNYVGAAKSSQINFWRER